ncbi:MAG: restriction endonuclease [Luteimonas sp.]
MAAWTGWLIPIAVFLLLGFAASFYLHRIRLPRDEAAAGVTALAGMRWRDFIHLVLAALNKRGYERIFDPDAAGDEGEYLLERNGQRWLLSSKHGAAYVLGSTAIAEFANAIRMRGAAGGLLVTPGQFAPEAVPLAAAQRIELLDGPKLWPQLRPLLPEHQRAVVSAPAQAQARRHVLLAWGGALVVGALLFTLSDLGSTDSATATTPVAPPTKPNAAARAPAPAAVAETSSPAPTDPAQLEQRRREVARAISTLSTVHRAVWSTQSTLLVYLADELADPMPDICPLLVRYEELGASRVQLQPPQGSTRPVRFVQCRAY